jgi:hypothetical protein
MDFSDTQRVYSDVVSSADIAHPPRTRYVICVQGQTVQQFSAA